MKMQLQNMIQLQKKCIRKSHKKTVGFTQIFQYNHDLYIWILNTNFQQYQDKNSACSQYIPLNFNQISFGLIYLSQNVSTQLLDSQIFNLFKYIIQVRKFSNNLIIFHDWILIYCKRISKIGLIMERKLPMTILYFIFLLNGGQRSRQTYRLLQTYQ